MKKWVIGLLILILFVGVGCQADAPLVVETAVSTPQPDPSATDDVSETAVSTPQPNSSDTDLIAITPMDLFLRPTVVEVTVVPQRATPVPSESPTSTPAEKTIIICQAAEPQSLFVYSPKTLDTDNVHHAIYENLYTTLDYGYQAQGLEKLPSLDDGSARITAVSVQAGDWVVDINGAPTELVEGVAVQNSAGETIIFDGSSLEMNQLEANFTLKPMFWSDGTAVSAADSVLGFEVNQALIDPVSSFIRSMDHLVARTAVYEATGDLTLRWVGIPGYFDSTYFLNVWPLLPHHQVGDRPLNEMGGFSELARMPLSTGPFVVSEWEAGSQIVLEPNPYYYRQAEGLPKVDGVTVKFISDSNSLVGQLLSGACDIGTSSAISIDSAPFLQEAEQNGLLTPRFLNTAVYEHLDFGINSYGDYGDGNGRPDWFEDVHVRQAFAHCIDRQALVDAPLFEQGDTMHSYLLPDHPLRSAETVWPYDVTLGNSLLDEVGVVDTNGDGIREATDGTPFAITLISNRGGTLRPAIAELIQADLADCGVDVELRLLSGDELFNDPETSPVFSRQFDLALFAWVGGAVPACESWLSSELSGSLAEGFVNGWNGRNNTGWQNEAFDSACQAGMMAEFGSEAWVMAHETAVSIFSEELPILPLFARQKVAVAGPEISNFQPNPSQPSDLWNLFEIGRME